MGVFLSIYMYLAIIDIGLSTHTTSLIELAYCGTRSICERLSHVVRKKN